jgi:hypothetical protein
MKPLTTLRLLLAAAFLLAIGAGLATAFWLGDARPARQA